MSKKATWNIPRKGLNEKFLSIPIDLFNYEARVILTDSITESYKERRDIFGNKSIGNPRGLCCAMYGGVAYLLLEYAGDAGTVAHETSHLVWDIMDHIGAKHENEVNAYCTGFLIRKITPFIYNEGLKREKRLKDATTIKSKRKATTK
jgi:hypothetical protein